MPGRVIFVNRFFHPDHSATAQLLADLSFELARRGWAVAVVTSRLRYDDARARLPACETVRGVAVRRVWTSRFGRGRLSGRAVDYLTFYLSTFFALLRAVRRGDVVVALTDPPLISVVAGWVCRLRGARLVNWTQDLFPEVAAAARLAGLHGWPGRALERLRNASLRRAAANVALGEAMASRLAAAGAPGVRVIPNWADGAAIRPAPAGTNPLRAAWGLGRRFVVGYSGNLGRVHDAQTFIGGAQRLRDTAQVAFLFIGGGAGRTVVEAHVREHGLDNVVFQPYQPYERLAESLGAADVHLVSLRPEMEGLVFPSKLYGILAAGRPVVFVGDPAGEIARLVTDEGCGLAVAQGDAAALANAVRLLASDPARCADMGRRARALLDARFDRCLALDAWSETLAPWLAGVDVPRR